ncbi:Uncharacterised protein [Serratia fonticola]|uniref:Uncharacterized protein n=1 Tax=Serratia fonticola TaxID=47917 RepID=A0A4U9WIQ6_SERFO|nr:Uncharacterised protein [Serratia fonticola]
MAIPEIENYDLASLVLTEPNKVDWLISPSRGILLVP